MKLKIYTPLSIYELGQRSNQEDALWPLKPSADSHQFVLCDGMGGHEKGEVASQTVCQSLGTWFQEHVSADAHLTDDQLREALEYAYQELDKYDDNSPKQMGTTLTLLYIGSNGVTAAHIGDSRIYHIRPNKGVLYQSRDHSLVFDLFQAGEISLEEMDTHPQKNIITRAMTPGMDKRTRADIVHITDIEPGDYFYMCSDGMLEQMSNDELVSLLTHKRTDVEKQEQLIAVTSNNKDNHTAWIIHVKEVVKEEGDEALVNEEPTARCNAINLINKVKHPLYDEEEMVEEAEVDVEPSPTNKKKIGIKRLLFLLLAILAFIVALWAYFSIRQKKEELHPPKSALLSPLNDTGKNILFVNHLSSHKSDLFVK